MYESQIYAPTLVSNENVVFGSVRVGNCLLMSPFQMQNIYDAAGKGSQPQLGLMLSQKQPEKHRRPQSPRNSTFGSCIRAFLAHPLS